MAEDVLGLITSRYSKAKTYREIYESKWDELYKMYRFKMDSKTPGRSNLYIPYAFSNVETVFPRLVAKSPRYKVLPVSPNDVASSMVMKTLLEYAWESYGVDEIVRRWVKGMLIYGSSVVKVIWKKEIKKRAYLDTDVVDGKSELVGINKESAVTYDGPCVKDIDLRSLYIDPDAMTIEDARYVIHQEGQTRSELESNPNYKAKDLKQVTYGFTNDEIRRGLHMTQETTSNEAEVLEYWEDDRLVVIAGGVVLRDEPNPYSHKKKPFVMIIDHIDDRVPYGIGEVEPVEALQNEMNTLRNMRMDFNTLSLNPTFSVKSGSVTDVNQVKFAPGYKIIVQGDTDAIRAIPMPQAPNTSYREEESIMRDFQTITGVSDYAKGSEASSLNNTATGISLIQEAANQRFNAKLQNLEIGLQKVAEFMRDLYMQFLTDEMIIRITDKEGFSFQAINPQDIKGEFDIRIERSSTAPSNKLQDRNEEMNKYNVLSANPLIQQTPEALAEMTRSLLEKWDDPSLEPIMKALQSQIDEIARKKQEQEAMQNAQLEAQAMVDQEMSDENQQAMAEQTRMDQEMPPEFRDMAANMLKGTGPMPEGTETGAQQIAQGL